jgi:hypothetical protein
MSDVYYGFLLLFFFEREEEEEFAKEILLASLRGEREREGKKISDILENRVNILHFFQ